MNFEPRNLFITGGAGFIGSNFVHHWLANTREGKGGVFDALTYAGNIESLSDIANDPRYLFVKGDICDEDKVRGLLAQHQIDTLVHFAAESHVDRSILGPPGFITSPPTRSTGRWAPMMRPFTKTAPTRPTHLTPQARPLPTI